MSLIKSISGIRGIIGGTVGNALTPIDIANFTLGFGTMIKRAGGKKIVVGRDARVSGEMVHSIVVGNLLSIGIDVIDLGLSTTPTVEIAVTSEQADGGIIITASHNPKQWNALKLLNSDGEFISKELGEEMLAIAESKKFDFVDVENLGVRTYVDDYIQRHIDKILELPYIDLEAIKKKQFKIAYDAVNSVGGIAVPLLLKALGVENVVELFNEPNGLFPHNPEPLPEHLSILCSEVKLHQCDLGIAVDPDVDRVAFVDEKGNCFGEEYSLVAVADFVLQTNKGATVSNLSSSVALKDITEAHGCQYFASAVGEVNVVALMKEKNAVIGGEGNGGVILPELHYGRDALVGIALFLTYIAKSDKTVSSVRAQFPHYVISKNKVQLEEGMNVGHIISKISDRYAQYEQNTIDGLKIIFEDYWVHLRSSNTEPIIRIYAESSTEATAHNIANKIKGDIISILKEA
ncbi:MAG: phosphoglucosamine mutase [Chitinophagales bacterium]|nr:phosphoglucosamine mutase [Chitinophagales bacterium]